MELAPLEQARQLEGPAPLAALADKVKRRSEGCRDREVVLGHTRLRVDGTWMYDSATGKLSPHALRQLCARLPLPNGSTPPAGYLARCPEPLAAYNLNHWLSRSPGAAQTVLVREQKGANARHPIVRAVLSDKYAPVDHLPLIETLERLAPQHELKVNSWSLDDEVLTLRLLVDADHPASLDDPLRVGLHISNSEIGLGRISITALVTRLVCTNGLVVKVADLGGIHRRHVGRAGESLQEIALGALPLVLQEADEAAKRFVRLREEPAPQPVEEFVAKTALRAELPESALPLLQGALEGETLFDVVNAFTRVAQQFPVAERVRIETHMSQFLRDGRNWN